MIAPGAGGYLDGAAKLFRKGPPFFVSRAPAEAWKTRSSVLPQYTHVVYEMHACVGGQVVNRAQRLGA